MDEKERRKRLASLPFSEKLKILERLLGPQSRDCCQRVEDNGRSTGRGAVQRRKLQTVIGFGGPII